MKKWLAIILLSLFMIQTCGAEEEVITLRKANIDLHDKASLQRGAKYFMNYCAGCHSLKYVRYNRMARDIGIVDEDDNVDEKLLKDNLIFTGAKVGDPILNAMTEADGHKWFGVAPPDLSLEKRVRGADWLFTYLTSFYNDDKRPWGTNNLLFPDVAMPNVLERLQGTRIPIYRSKTIPYDGGKKEIQVINYLQRIESGTMTEQEFDAMARDLVNFLTFMSEPIVLERQQLGKYVLLFLSVLLVLSYFLKQDFWEELKKK